MSLPQDPDAVALRAEFPDWEIWQTLDSAWHARVRNATPPAMVHGADLAMLREQIVARIWFDNYEKQQYEKQQQAWSRERPKLRPDGDDDDR